MSANKPMTPKERENVTQAFIDIYRGDTEKYKSKTVDTKTAHNKKKLCLNDKERLQEVTMRLLQVQ